MQSCTCQQQALTNKIYMLSHNSSTLLVETSTVPSSTARLNKQNTAVETQHIELVRSACLTSWQMVLAPSARRFCSFIDKFSEIPFSASHAEHRCSSVVRGGPDPPSAVDCVSGRPKPNKNKFSMRHPSTMSVDDITVPRSPVTCVHCV